MVGSYTEDLAKLQNCKNWGVGTCIEMGACLEHYSTQILCPRPSQVHYGMGGLAKMLKSTKLLTDA